MAILTIPSDEELLSFVEDFDVGHLERANGIEAGTVNTSYVLHFAGEKRLFLRIYEEQDDVGACREATLLAHLAAKGVPTPAPLVARDGRAVRSIAGKPAALFPWVEGQMLCQRSVTVVAAEAVGRALARIHEAGHAPDAPLGEGRFGPLDLVQRCERIAEARDPEARAMSSMLRDAVQAVAARRRRDAPRGLVHGDLFRDNVLWEPDSSAECSKRIAALLDFESAHDGPFAYDLAVTVLSWSFGSTFDTVVASSIVRGYRGVRELEEGDRLALFDEAIFATLRFTITRITDDAIRVGKRWQRFVERREALEQLGPRGLSEALGL